jgi:hypothetical protein
VYQPGRKETNVSSIDAPESAAVPDRSGSLGRFAIKTVTVTAAVTVALWIIIGLAFDRLDDMIDRRAMQVQEVIQSTVRIHSKSFWSRVEKELDRAASPANDLPSEKKQKLLADIRTLADRYRPFISAVAELFIEKPAVPTNPPR